MKFIKNRIILVNFLLSLFFNLGLWALLIYNIPPQDQPIFLHYNIYVGIDSLGPWYQVLFIPLSGSAVFLINLSFSFIIYKKDLSLSYLSLIFSSLVQVALAVAGVLVILLNQY